MTLRSNRLWKVSKKDATFYMKMLITAFLGAVLALVAVVGEAEDLSRVWNSLPIAFVVAIIVASLMYALYIEGKM